MSNEYGWSLWMDSEMMMKIMSDDYDKMLGKWVDQWHDEMIWQIQWERNEWMKWETNETKWEWEA